MQGTANTNGSRPLVATASVLATLQCLITPETSFNGNRAGVAGYAAYLADPEAMRQLRILQLLVLGFYHFQRLHSQLMLHLAICHQGLGTAAAAAGPILVSATAVLQAAMAISPSIVPKLWIS
jgi:hypothetical protein